MNDIIRTLKMKGLIREVEIAGRRALQIDITNLQYLELLKDGNAYLILEKSGTWVWDGHIMEG